MNITLKTRWKLFDFKIEEDERLQLLNLNFACIFMEKNPPALFLQKCNQQTQTHKSAIILEKTDNKQ